MDFMCACVLVRARLSDVSTILMTMMMMMMLVMIVYCYTTDMYVVCASSLSLKMCSALVCFPTTCARLIGMRFNFVLLRARTHTHTYTVPSSKWIRCTCACGSSVSLQTHATHEHHVIENLVCVGLPDCVCACVRERWFCRGCFIEQCT